MKLIVSIRLRRQPRATWPSGTRATDRRRQLQLPPFAAAAHGLDTSLNDHHYAYGYFIAAVAVMVRHDPGWWQRDDNSAMVRAIIADVANVDRSDRRFAYLRHFDVYAGHSWGSERIER